jgi:hypothetical protein
LECQEIAEETVAAMMGYANLYNSEGMITEFGSQMEVIQFKLSELKKDINEAIRSDSFTKFEDLKRSLKK